MMNLDQFRATGRDVPDLGVEITGCDLEGIPGRIYLHEGGVYLMRDEAGAWSLILGNEEYAGERDELERLLYDWARCEGFLDEAQEG